MNQPVQDVEDGLFLHQEDIYRPIFYFPDANLIADFPFEDEQVGCWRNYFNEYVIIVGN